MARKIQHCRTDRLGRPNLLRWPSSQRSMCARTNLSRDLGNGFLYKDVLSPARSAALTPGHARVGSPQCCARWSLGTGLPLAAASRRTALVFSRIGVRSPPGGAAHFVNSFFSLSEISLFSGRAEVLPGFFISVAAVS